MDKLLSPDYGLMIWTIITFLLLVFCLKKLCWGPLISAIEEREHRIKSDLDESKKAREDSERIKRDLEGQLADASQKGRDMLAQAMKEAELLRSQLKTTAETEAQKIREKTLQELADEKERLVRELRKEVAGLSVLAAERLMRKTVDDGVQKTVLEGFFKDLEHQKVS